MAKKKCRPANQPRCCWHSSVATPAMQDALWSLAASEPERFVAGLQKGKVKNLSDIAWWCDFKHSPGLRLQAELIIVLAADLGISEKSGSQRKRTG